MILRPLPRRPFVYCGTGRRRINQRSSDWRGTLYPGVATGGTGAFIHIYNYDLSINVAGIDAIHHMLERIESLQHQVRSLKSELQFYR